MVQDKMYTGCFDITRNNKSLYAVAWLISPEGERVWELQKRVEGLDRNEASYYALQMLLEEILVRGITAVKFLGTNSLVMKQASGQWQAKKTRLFNYCVKVRSLLANLRHFQFERLDREQQEEDQEVSFIPVPQVGGGQETEQFVMVSFW
ncbi:reverse transcriptase-like protein [Brevibacillus thermoruber]|uniref:Reverse transcriptase-like protein n=1 Tax=Brevibacillus thermoruber TaxID=33942 RepID=A0A9X3TUN3_9BACL|nr:reverse transcriptase-like protein [Brevibacillus thermoruber]MDA5110877.1 reverse transcriptase-like protein [Brevibacillus thermoruber]